MRIARLAATLTAAGVMVLASAAPTLATEPVGTVTPDTISVEGGFTATLTGCDADEASIETDLLEGPSEALDPTGENEFSKTFAGTDKNAKPGVHTVNFFCGETPAGSAEITVEAEEPVVDFDAEITPNPFQAGDRLTLTTTGCGTVPTVDDVDGLFTGPLELTAAGEEQHSGSAVTKANLPLAKVFRLIVTCEGEGTITFTTEPGKKVEKKTGDTGVVPVGGIDTGDGSTAQSGGGVLLPAAAGAAAVLLAAGLGLALRRRKAREAGSGGGMSRV
jgi:hypothetical protein